MAQQDKILRIESKLQSRENSTLMFASIAASASLLVFALLWEKNDSLQVPYWVSVFGFIFSILGPLYREITIFTIDNADYRRLRNWKYTFWETFPRMVIVRVLLYLPIAAWLILLVFNNPIIMTAATFAVAILISAKEWRVRKENEIITEEKRLSPNDAQRLSEHVMHTRFTWTVLLLTLLTGMVGLLAVSLNFEASIKSAFGLAVYIVYAGLSTGLSYSFYATCHTSFLIVYLTSKYENEEIKSFLKQYWSRFYTPFFSTERNNEIVFRKRLVIAGAVIVWLFSLLLLLLKP